MFEIQSTEQKSEVEKKEWIAKNNAKEKRCHCQI